ncbi:MAG: hypothetical protein GXP54_12015, partial [Deltaproteobacteria bacterium]|nr:hypothetical protein [Deltaproteobacteria bacterium]
MIRKMSCAFIISAWIACGGGGDESGKSDAWFPETVDSWETVDSGDSGSVDLTKDLAHELSDTALEGGDLEKPDVGTTDVVEDVLDGDQTDAGLPELIDLPEKTVQETLAQGPDGFILSNDQWNGLLPINYPSQADYTQTIEGLVYHFRPWVRFRMPHPGKVKRLFVYTSGSENGANAVEMRLSTGFPGGHHPCLDEDTGDDQYPVGPAFRMEVGADPGWRVFDVSGVGHEVGGYDEFFVIFRQEGAARVGLAVPRDTEPGDYGSYGGLIADVPGDQMGCFSTISVFTDQQDKPMVWLVRAEIEASEVLDQHRFMRPADGPNLGGHVAFGDYDDDGDDDILSGGALWRNDGSGGFENRTDAAGLTGLGGET